MIINNFLAFKGEHRETTGKTSKVEFIQKASIILEEISAKKMAMEILANLKN